MILTVVNQLATSLAVGYPISLTLGPNGGGADTAALGVSMEDLLRGEDFGNPAYKRLNLLEQEGKATVAIGVDADDENVLDEANEL